MNLRNWATAALLGGLMMGSVAARAQESVPGEVLVTMRPQAFESHHLRAMAARLGEVAGGQSALHAVRLCLHPNVRMEDALAQLRQRGDVLYAEPNYITHVQATPDDPFYATYQYAPQITQADKAWDLWTAHAPVVIAIVDTGVETAHPDLTNKIDRDAQGNVVGYDFIHGTAGAEDDNGHGTHCAGIAAAQTDSGIGIAGVAAWNGKPGTTDTQNIKIMPVKVMDSTGSGTEADIADGIIWAADHGAKVISLSMGGPQDSQTLESAIQYAWNKGCLICAAAGNSGTAAYSYPAACAHVLSVAATDNTDTLASYSNYGSWVQVAAPGSNIASTWLNNQYAMASGTSMACPFVAGEAALVWSDVPTLSNEKLGALLTSNVDPVLPYQGNAIAPGAGRVNVYKALLAAVEQRVHSGAAPVAPVAAPPVSLAAVSLDASNVKGGQPVHLTVTLAAPAPAGGVTVTLTSSGSSFGAKFTVPAGKPSVTVTLTPAPVRQATTLTLAAAAQGVTKSVTLTVLPPALRTFALSATQVTGGTGATGTLVLDSPAPSGGFPVPLRSLSTAVQVPASVTIPAGSASATFPVRTQAVSHSLTVTLAAAGSTAKTAILTLLPASTRH